MEAIRFYDVKGVKVENQLKENLKEAQKQGYTCMAWYINSDEEHLYLAKKWKDAENKAVEMYKENTGYNDSERNFYNEKVSMWEIEEFLTEC